MSVGSFLGGSTKVARAGKVSLKRYFQRLPTASAVDDRGRFLRHFAQEGSKLVIKDRRYWGINHFMGATGPFNTGHSDDKLGCKRWPVLRFAASCLGVRSRTREIHFRNFGFC